MADAIGHLTQVQVGDDLYDLWDARITGGVLNFRGVVSAGTVTDGTTVTQVATPAYKEGDVVIEVPEGKEFIVVNTGSAATPALT